MCAVESGEVVRGGDSVMKSYCKRPEETARCFVGVFFFHAEDGIRDDMR